MSNITYSSNQLILLIKSKFEKEWKKMYVCNVVKSPVFDILLPTTLRLTVSMRRFFWSPKSNVLIMTGKNLI